MRPGFAPPVGVALDEAIVPIRAAVLGGTRRSTRTRLRRRLTLLATAAAVSATALVVGNLTSVSLQGIPESAAASSLNAAADAAIRTADPVVVAGEYLEVSTRRIASYDGDAGHLESGVFLSSQTTQLFVPADSTEEWVRVEGPLRVEKTFGELSARAAALASRNQQTITFRAAAGRFFGDSPAVTTSTLRSLPRDPSKLLEVIHKRVGKTGNSRDGETLVFIADLLRTGRVPAELRAALYRAVALIPGVTITQREATLDGRTGVAFGRPENNGTRQEIIIDPTTGLLIGERTVQTTASASDLPIGTAIDSTAVVTTVSSRAPAVGSVCGEPRVAVARCP